ncbi:UPF0193 protein EVG1 homolog, partial [Arctopsyche grandis]|uniref:UPF0193 protein EVG1 homolog n=1 Tax=Arctopsyche grandis TaxID=121162 RepID=UPI00406DA40C
MDSNRVLEWPSRRIPPGGVFHHPKSAYSQETHSMLKTIMEESKLTLYQQRQIDWCLRSGSSLADAKQELRQKRTSSAPAFFKSPPKESRRRTLSAIKNSGDFDREKFADPNIINCYIN